MSSKWISFGIKCLNWPVLKQSDLFNNEQSGFVRKWNCSRSDYCLVAGYYILYNVAAEFFLCQVHNPLNSSALGNTASSRTWSNWSSLGYPTGGTGGEEMCSKAMPGELLLPFSLLANQHNTGDVKCHHRA